MGRPTQPPADTVASAAGDPELAQPYAELGLRTEEYQRIREVLGRRPTESELAMYSVMWSEHCSYKSSRVHLRRFGELPPSARQLAGIGANAGVVDVGNGLAVTFKVESHNHPSYVEPYQGAATGVGGIVRDILAMGARPIAVMDSLRFGDPLDPDSADDVRRCVRGVVAGVGGYGNCLGLPNIGGEVVFDASYAGNPLVNALCVGVLPAARLQTASATGPGNAVVLFGARTGRDGIGGVSVLASAGFDADGPARRPSVQVGDPFAEKVVTECCLHLFDADLVVGIQDLGGAGLTCAISETAAAARSGMDVDLDAVVLREPSMAPWEILVSESQERMLAIVAPDKVAEVLAVCERWGVPAAVIGTVTDSGRLVVRSRGQVVVDVPPGSLADEGPVYSRPMARPAWLDARQADTAEALARVEDPETVTADLLALLGSPNLCSRRWVTEQYDRYVRGNTVLAMPEDAGVIRLDPEQGLGIALALDGNGRYAALDPYAGAQLSLAEAARNVAAVGAEPYAVTNCLNFGSPEDPEVMWAFSEAVRGLADGCRELGLPVTGGNVSFYNATAGEAIQPTPVVGVLGLLADVGRRVSSAFDLPDLDLLLLGPDDDVELSGSAWAGTCRGHLGGRPPRVDWAGERALHRLLVGAAQAGELAACHDISDGGLAVALAECCLGGGVGATVVVPPGRSLTGWLFGETSGRAVVAANPGAIDAIRGRARAEGVAVRGLGSTGGGWLTLGPVAVPLDRLVAVREATFPALFD